MFHSWNWVSQSISSDKTVRRSLDVPNVQQPVLLLYRVEHPQILNPIDLSISEQYDRSATVRILINGQSPIKEA